MAGGHLLQHFFAQEATQPRGDLGQSARIRRRQRRPGEEIGEQRPQRFRGCELAAGRFDIAVEQDEFRQFAVAPQAEAGAVRVEQVGQGLELAPLLLVVPVRELARIAALARRLDLDEANQRIGDADRVVRARVELRQRRFADQRQAARRQIVERGEAMQQRFERRAKLVLGRARHGRAVQLGAGPKAETSPAKVDCCK